MKGRVAELSAIRDQARTDAKRAVGIIERAGSELTAEKMEAFAEAARQRLRKSDGAYQRDHLRAVGQRVKMIDKTQALIKGSRTTLLKIPVTADAQTTAYGVPILELKWRAGEDSNPRPLDS